ncbi:hypothetical protein GCM10022251_67400 [Phytohabitans flavus]|uniref:Uncharacterized protein n=1 Tax=Phytohabitans flavus TaxID=1076124 RepID=A0A6F8Y4X7_9ACTN|nr:hypothetical protein Pflav_075550 [Phytohabitans flavus]
MVATPDSAVTDSGRTLEGPQPKRPSAGLRSSGIRMLGVSATAAIFALTPADRGIARRSVSKGTL